MGKLLFVTGTDTGIGKTIVTAALLALIRSFGRKAWALKPFCSGGRGDARLFYALQDRELSLDVVNPVHFREPLAPLVAARRERRTVDIRPVVAQVHELRRECDCLLVEGCGGVMVPLTESHTVLDFAVELQCPAILVAANRLGALNHILLSLNELSRSKVPVAAVVLVEPSKPTVVSRTNRQLLAQWVKPAIVVAFRHLGRGIGAPERIEKNLGKVKKDLAPLIRMDILNGVGPKARLSMGK